MSSVLKITKMHFSALFNVQIIICAAVMLLHILISAAVIWLADTPGPAGVGDFVAIVWVTIMGLIFFSPSFRYTLSLGISRKTFFFAGSLSIAAVAAVIAIVTTAFYFINLQVSNVWMIYKLLYQNQNIISLVLWEFAALFFLGILGWLIRLIYYVSNRYAKLIVSVVPFVLASLLILFNALAGGGIGRAVLNFLKTVMGLSSTVPNPYIGIASLLAAAIILGGPVYLLLRRAQIND